MQPKKQIHTFNIRKILKKNGNAYKNVEENQMYTPQFQYDKYAEIGIFTNPKKEKQLIIDQSVNEAILNSKIYIDLKRTYQENKKKNLEKKKELELEMQKIKVQKKQALEEEHRLSQEKQKYEQMIKLMKQKIMQLRDKNKDVRDSLQSRMSNEAEYLSNLIISMRFQAEYEHDIDPDQMTYEQLLELEEKIGQVSRGLPKEVIQKLPKIEITQNSEETCTICFSVFEYAEIMTKLIRCKHEFHFDCLASWLEKEKVCPVCKQEVLIDPLNQKSLALEGNHSQQSKEMFQNQEEGNQEKVQIKVQS